MTDSKRRTLEGLAAEKRFGPRPQRTYPHRRDSGSMNDNRVQDLRPIGEVAAEIVADLWFRRQIENLHRLGPRAVGELLAEIGAERSIQTVIDKKLDRYAQLDPEALEAAGAGGFWQPPLHVVPRT